MLLNHQKTTQHQTLFTIGPKSQMPSKKRLLNRGLFCFLIASFAGLLSFSAEGTSPELNAGPSFAQVDKETLKRDTSRYHPSLVDIGILQSYRLTPTEIAGLSSRNLKGLLENIIRRYYDMYLYFTRDIILSQSNTDYPAEIIDNLVAKEVYEKSDEELRRRLNDFYNHQDGVTKENTRLYSLIDPAIKEHEVKKFGKDRSPNLPPFHSANALYLAYLKKLEIRPLNYFPDFAPSAPTAAEAKQASDDWSLFLGAAKSKYGILFLLLSLCLGFGVGYVVKKS